MSRSTVRQRELPTFYYHKHFLELLDFVAAHYRHILSPDELTYVTEFRALDRPAQCLYVRLVNRKGRVFAVDKLRYPEIGDMAGPIAALRTAGWVTSPGPEFFREVLGFLTKAEIQAGLAPLIAGLGRGMSKRDLVTLASERADPEQFIRQVDPQRLLLQRRTNWVRFLLFLYFGEVREGLSRFTMRDMGLVRTHSFTEDYEPRFADREEAVETYYFAARLRQFERGDDHVRRELFDEAAGWPQPQFDGAAEARDRLAFAMGRELERAGRNGDAMRTYALGDSPECSERLVRLLFAAGDHDRARSYLEACLQNPRSDDEWHFARDLYRRKFDGKRTSSLTDALRSAETIELDEAHSGSPERAAIGHFKSLGQQAFRAENTLWRSLFGLMFWDELFCNGSLALHSPFESMPASLSDGSFYGAHRGSIEDKLEALADRAGTRHRLLKTSTRNYGTPNGVFRWRRDVAETAFALVDHGEPAAIAAMLRRMCQDYRRTRYGFPDLMLVDQEGVRFAEIKAEGDQVRRNQLSRIEQLRDAGFRADVVRIRWILDPLQVYVVVDVETTGGAGEQHRITEIAAVKVCGNEVIDSYQTLVNPQRPIPTGITRLTGISNAMVADAPVFADIADEFAEFMGNAIFVAHNVNFDYGFVAREFARLGRRFRHARLCTCASMRRLYPGLPSYSLGALCGEFRIPLRQHHRALCDAEAAAELLFIVNERRAALLGGDSGTAKHST